MPDSLKLAVAMLAIAAGFLTLAVSADAATSAATTATLDRMYPGRTAADDPRSHGLQGAAYRYWHRKGVGMHEECEASVEFFWSDLEGRGWGEANLCWATLDREYVFDVARGPASEFTPGWGRRWWAAQECGMWAHELGHALGLEHEDAGRYPVMADYGGVVPRECWRTARKWYGPKRRHRR
jgi:hypothetical protein